MYIYSSKSLLYSIRYLMNAITIERIFELKNTLIFQSEKHHLGKSINGFQKIHLIVSGFPYLTWEVLDFTLKTALNI